MTLARVVKVTGCAAGLDHQSFIVLPVRLPRGVYSDCGEVNKITVGLQWLRGSKQNYSGFTVTMRSINKSARTEFTVTTMKWTYPQWINSDYNEGNKITLSLQWLQWVTEFTVTTIKETKSYWNHIGYDEVNKTALSLQWLRGTPQSLQEVNKFTKSLQRLQGRKHSHTEFSMITRKETQSHWVYSDYKEGNTIALSLQ